MDKKDLTVELPNFEGPLDLLLHLIQSQKSIFMIFLLPKLRVNILHTWGKCKN